MKLEWGIQMRADQLPADRPRFFFKPGPLSDGGNAGHIYVNALESLVHGMVGELFTRTFR